MPSDPSKAHYDLVRLILSGPPDTRLVRGARAVEAFLKARDTARKPRGVNTTDHVADLTDPVRDARNSQFQGAGSVNSNLTPNGSKLE